MNLFVAIRVLGDSAITSASGSALRNAKQQIIRKMRERKNKRNERLNLGRERRIISKQKTMFRINYEEN